MLYALAAANALLVFYDFAIRHGGELFLPRLMFASACAVLPFLVALVLARLIAKSGLEVSSKAVSAFQANLEIFWILSLVIVTLAE